MKQYYLTVRIMEDAYAFHKEISNESLNECKMCHKHNRNQNALTTFLFVRVLESEITNESKSLIDFYDYPNN